MNEVQERERRIKHKLNNYESSFSIDGNKIDLSKIKDHSLHIEDFEKCKGNTKGHVELFKKLDNSTLEKLINIMLKNSSMKVDCTTYDEMLINVVLPELIDRLNKIHEDYSYSMFDIDKALVHSWDTKSDLLIYPKEKDTIIVKNNIKDDNCDLNSICVWQPKCYKSFIEYRSNVYKYLDILK